MIRLMALLLFSLAASSALAQTNPTHQVNLGNTWTDCYSMTDCAQKQLDYYCTNTANLPSGWCFDATITEIQVAGVAQTSQSFASLPLNEVKTFNVLFDSQVATNTMTGNFQIKRIGSLCEQGGGKYARYSFNLCAYGSCPSTRPSNIAGTVCYQGCKATIETSGDFDVQIGTSWSYGQTGILKGINETCSGFPSVTVTSSFTDDRNSLGGSSSGGSSGGGTNETCGVAGKPSCESLQTQKEQTLTDLVKPENMPTFGGRGDGPGEGKWFYFLDKAIPTESSYCKLETEITIPFTGGQNSQPKKFKIGFDSCPYATYIQQFMYWAMFLITSAGCFMVAFRGTGGT